MLNSFAICDGVSDAFLQKVREFLAEWQSESEEIHVKTSGSTGEPKLIRLNKARVKASAKATGAFFNFQPGQRVLLNLSPDYIAGKLMLVRALEHDMQVVIAPNQQNPLENLTDMELDFGAFVPYQVEAMLKNEHTRRRYQNIKNVIIGGAPVSLALEQELKTLTNQSFATFGMTETITHFALRNLSAGDSFYRCLPGITIRQDERRCLIIEPNAVCNELVTNDLIEPINPHEFKWLGRADFVVNSGGIKLSPEQLEKKVSLVLENYAFYFGGRPSEKYGEELVLYIEGEEPEGWDELYAQVCQQLGKYERPKAVVFMPEFERTETGKIKRIRN
mgnify:CR=1 FL=1